MELTIRGVTRRATVLELRVYRLTHDGGPYRPIPELARLLGEEVAAVDQAIAALGAAGLMLIRH